jgi:tetratricopeptide (TPR) repeat protein
MKRLFLLLQLLFSAIVFAQPQDATTMHQTAKSFIGQGDYENAILVLNRALQAQPNNLELLKDLAFAAYLKRDYTQALDAAKKITKRDDADAQCYQIAGMVHRSVADYKEGEKLYKQAIKKFPNAGVLYNDYGEMLVDKKAGSPISLWEKGIEIDPNYSANYYNAAKHYSLKKDHIRALLYGETFINLESFSQRSTEIKNLLLDEYKALFLSQDMIGPYKKDHPFYKNVVDILNRQNGVTVIGITPESLTAIRTRFILEWYASANPMACRLFEHHRQLLQEGLFEAYNHWVFGAASNLAAFQLWQNTNAANYNDFLKFIRGRVYKIPSGQYYSAN